MFQHITNLGTQNHESATPVLRPDLNLHRFMFKTLLNKQTVHPKSKTAIHDLVIIKGIARSAFENTHENFEFENTLSLHFGLRRGRSQVVDNRHHIGS